MIDFHCHVDLYSEPHDILRECKTRGMRLLSVTTTPSAWSGTCALSRDNPAIQTALGLHPELVGERKKELSLFDELVLKTRYVGEIGLDGTPETERHWTDQVEVFEHILTSCEAAGGRVMSIHSRRASSEVLDRLETRKRAGVPILHWFSGSFRDLNRAIELGCWFSVGPAMLTSTKGRNLTQRMPQDRVLTESDGPFARVSGRSILPWEVSIAVASLAKLWNVQVQVAQHVLSDNLHRLDRITV